MSLVGLAVAAALSGLIFVFLGAYLSLAEVMQPWQAGAIVGSAVMLIAIILLVIAVLVIGWQRRTTTGSVPLRGAAASPEGGPSSRNDGAGLLGMSVGDMLAKSNIKTTDIVLSALVAGMVLGASPRLRQWIFGHKREETKGPPAND
jgi:hypothetical protein